MSRLYKVLNKKDCAELGLSYSPTMKIVLAEHNSGHYTVTRYASTFGKVCIVLLSPMIMLWHIGRGIYAGAHDCLSAIHDTFEMCDRRDYWGEDHPYIGYLKDKY